MSRKRKHDPNAVHHCDVTEKYRMCRDKNRYDTEWDAIHAALSASRKFGAMRTYHCPYCDGYHMTHSCVDDD